MALISRNEDDGMQDGLQTALSKFEGWSESLPRRSVAQGPEIQPDLLCPQPVNDDNVPPLKRQARFPVRMRNMIRDERREDLFQISESPPLDTEDRKSIMSNDSHLIQLRSQPEDFIRLLHRGELLQQDLRRTEVYSTRSNSYRELPSKGDGRQSQMRKLESGSGDKDLVPRAAVGVQSRAVKSWTNEFRFRLLEFFEKEDIFGVGHKLSDVFKNLTVLTDPRGLYDAQLLPPNQKRLSEDRRVTSLRSRVNSSAKAFADSGSDSVRQSLAGMSYIYDIEARAPSLIVQRTDVEVQQDYSEMDAWLPPISDAQDLSGEFDRMLNESNFNTIEARVDEIWLSTTFWTTGAAEIASNHIEHLYVYLWLLTSLIALRLHRLLMGNILNYYLNRYGNSIEEKSGREWARLIEEFWFRGSRPLSIHPPQSTDKLPSDSGLENISVGVLRSGVTVISPVSSPEAIHLSQDPPMTEPTKIDAPSSNTQEPNPYPMQSLADLHRAANPISGESCSQNATDTNRFPGSQSASIAEYDTSGKGVESVLNHGLSPTNESLLVTSRSEESVGSKIEGSSRVQGFEVLNGMIAEFVLLSEENHEEQGAYLTKHPELLRFNLSLLYVEALRQISLNNYPLAKRCISAMVLIRICGNLRNEPQIIESRVRSLQDPQTKCSKDYRKLFAALEGDVLETASKQAVPSTSIVQPDSKDRDTPQRTTADSRNAQPANGPHSSKWLKAPRDKPASVGRLQGGQATDILSDSDIMDTISENMSKVFKKTPFLQISPQDFADTEMQNISSQFKIQNNAPRWFVPGRVFSILWHEPAGQSSKTRKHVSDPNEPTDGYWRTHLSRNTTVGPHGELIFSQIKRMVVIRSRQTYCWCIGITTYGGQGLKKRHLRPSDVNAHAIIYDSRNSPSYLPNEPETIKDPIPVDLRPGQSISRVSRLHYGKPLTVEYNTPVQHVGDVKGRHLAIMLSDVKNELFGDLFS